MPEGFFGHVREIFKFDSLADLRKEWGQLSEKDKYHLRKGIEDGSMDYDPNEEPPESK